MYAWKILREELNRGKVKFFQLMTHLSHLRISGFKSIDEIEVEPSKINLITGRNNYGKTSLLESIALLSNPEYIKEFEDRVGKIINVNRSSLSISYKYRKEQFSVFDDYSSENPGMEQGELGVRRAKDREVSNILIHTIDDIIELNEEYPTRSPYIIDEDSLNGGELNEIVQQTLRKSLSNLSEETLLKNASSNIVILEFKGQDYPYIFLDESYDRLREVLIDDAIKIFEEQYSLPEEYFVDNQDTAPLRNTYQNMLVPRFGRGRFIDDSPPQFGGVKFKKRVRLNAEEVNLEKDNAAIRTQRIENYIRDNNIVKGLKDFSFNKLVFADDDGEPYEIPYEFMGDGFKTVVGVLWELFDENREGNILLLEEPENHMHPGYIESLVEQLISISEKSGVQLFITTHNYDFINAFISEHISRKHSKYLEESFKLFQLTEPVNREYGYEEVQHKLDDLNLDLRGI